MESEHLPLYREAILSLIDCDKKQLLLKMFRNFSIERESLYSDVFEDLHFKVPRTMERFHFYTRTGVLTDGGLNVIRNLSVTTTQITMNEEYSNFQSIFYSNTHINPDFWGAVSQNNIQTFHGCLALY